MSIKRWQLLCIVILAGISAYIAFVVLLRCVVKTNGISRFGLEKILKLDIYRKHPLINFAKIFSSR